MAAPETPSQRKWKNIFVGPFAQIKLGAYALLLSVIYSASLGIFLWDTYSEQIFRFESTYPSENMLSLFEQNAHWAHAYAVAVTIVVFVLTLLLVILRRTQRMFGPLVPMERFLDALNKGIYTERLNVRKNDDFQDLAEALNRVAEALEKRERRA